MATNTTRTQVWIGALGFAFFVVAMTWMLTHKKPRVPGLSNPRILSLVAKRGEASRPITEGAALQRDEVLDFEVEVFELCFVYVFKVESSTVSLAFAHQASDDPWDRGVYAPNWKEDTQGMRFMMPGDVALHVVTSPLPLTGLTEWAPKTFDDLSEKCPRCGAARVSFKLAPDKPLPAP